MAKESKTKNDEAPVESGATEPSLDLVQRVARLEHQLTVLAPIAELLPLITQIRRHYSGGV